MKSINFNNLNERNDNLKIDDINVSVEAGTTILEAKKANVRIPTLCYHDLCTPAIAAYV